MTTSDRKLAEGILLTDQYQLTMAQLYFRMGIHEKSVQFDYFFRSYPDYGRHQAGYCISAGLGLVLEWMQYAQVSDEEVDYLATHKTSTGARLFKDEFLKWLRENGNFNGITLRSIPEGRVVHPLAPLMVVQGPLA